MSASQTTMDKLYGMRLSVMAQAYRDQEEMLSVADMTFDDMQRAYFRALLERTGGRVSGAGGAAERAGMHPNTLRSRLEKLGITLRRTVG